jgi:beta-N-acetylhexosaminidase
MSLLPARGSRPILSLTYAGGVGVPGGASEAFDATLRRAGLAVTRLTLPTRTAAAVADSLIRAWEGMSSTPLVIVSAYTLPIPGRGSPGVPPAAAAAIERIARRTPLVYVAFGGPYASASVPSASTVIVAWTGIPAAQRATARVILGDRPATGRLPVALPPAYPVGHGIVSSP